MIKEYADYLKDNPEGYWFKRKLYGWGWVPARWQGWLTIAIYVALVLFLVFRIDENVSLEELACQHLGPLLVLTIALIFICYKKGEKPSWQWGLKKEEKNEIDRV